MSSSETQTKFSMVVSQPNYQAMINSAIGDPARARSVVAGAVAAVSVNAELQKCKASTILACAFLGDSLNLSPSPQLGQFYMVPFKQKAKYDRNGNMVRPESHTAQFVLGYKGYVQLALRSGEYRDLDAMEIKEGEYLGRDAMNRPIFRFIEDDEQRENAKTVGYMAYLETKTGFTKMIYWSKAKMMSHADTYSPAFSASAYQKLLNGEIPDGELWKYSSFWYKSFDEMAKKTMLRQLISKWGVMSAEIQNAFSSDSALLDADRNGNVSVLDMPKEEPQELPPEPQEKPKAKAVKFDEL